MLRSLWGLRGINGMSNKKMMPEQAIAEATVLKSVKASLVLRGNAAT